MNANHTISDLIARINNALAKNKKSVTVPNTNIIRSLLNILEKQLITKIKLLETTLEFTNKKCLKLENQIVYLKKKYVKCSWCNCKNFDN